MRFNDVVSEFLIAAKEGPRIFFAPLIGAVNAVRSELMPRPAHVPVRPRQRFSATQANKLKR